MDISRIRKNNGFYYIDVNKRVVTDESVLGRIQKNKIPPNWENVRISSSPFSYLQVVGVDSKGRTQYLYHPLWKELVKNDKFSRLEKFIEKLPKLRKRVSKILSRPFDASDKEFVVALVVRILEKTYSRIGNEVHKKENNTYGLTTLLKKHVNVIGNKISIKYVGKKNVEQSYSFDDEPCAKGISNLMKIRGDALFKTSDGQIVKSYDINSFIKRITGGEFTSKDYRTYATNTLLLDTLYKSKIPSTDTEAKNTLNKCCNYVAEVLGHTKQVSRTNYICPAIIKEYEKNPSLFIKTKMPISSILKNN